MEFGNCVLDVGIGYRWRRISKIFAWIDSPFSGIESSKSRPNNNNNCETHSRNWKCGSRFDFVQKSYQAILEAARTSLLRMAMAGIWGGVGVGRYFLLLRKITDGNGANDTSTHPKCPVAATRLLDHVISRYAQHVASLRIMTMIENRLDRHSKELHTISTFTAGPAVKVFFPSWWNIQSMP
jgi:hypothetical protein